jgi:hypothetical protein
VGSGVRRLHVAGSFADHIRDSDILGPFDAWVGWATGRPQRGEFTSDDFHRLPYTTGNVHYPSAWSSQGSKLRYRPQTSIPRPTYRGAVGPAGSLLRSSGRQEIVLAFSKIQDPIPGNGLTFSNEEVLRPHLYRG